MKDYTFTQQFALIGLNGLDALYSSNAKTAIMRGTLAAKFFENHLTLFASENVSDEQAVELQAEWKDVLKTIRALNTKRAKELEEEITNELKSDNVLEVVQDILACDLNYTTAEVDLKAYRTKADVYQRIIEGVRAEILEEGPVSAECFGFLWLMRETGCLHEYFSNEEQRQLEKRIIDLNTKNPVWRMLWAEEFHNIIENVVAKFLKGKSNLFKNPYLEGVNLVFPFVERRKAIFIDFVTLGTNVSSRRKAIMDFLAERGHFVEEVKNGSETLLKIDNTYYRIFPSAKRIPKAPPVQGAYIVPIYK